jgi:hypothetical protein
VLHVDQAMTSNNSQRYPGSKLFTKIRKFLSLHRHRSSTAIANRGYIRTPHGIYSAKADSRLSTSMYGIKEKVFPKSTIDAPAISNKESTFFVSFQVHTDKNR